MPEALCPQSCLSRRAALPSACWIGASGNPADLSGSIISQMLAALNLSRLQVVQRSQLVLAAAVWRMARLHWLCQPAKLCLSSAGQSWLHFSSTRALLAHIPLTAVKALLSGCGRSQHVSCSSVQSQTRLVTMLPCQVALTSSQTSKQTEALDRARLLILGAGTIPVSSRASLVTLLTPAP